MEPMVCAERPITVNQLSSPAEGSSASCPFSALSTALISESRFAFFEEGPRSHPALRFSAHSLTAIWKAALVEMPRCLAMTFTARHKEG